MSATVRELSPGQVPGDAPAATTGPVPLPVRLNLGCGRTILPGWVNIDRVALPGVDMEVDFERCRVDPLEFADNSVDQFLLSHTLEHIRDSLGLMEELHRVARPGAHMTVRIPYGSSDDAWEDPTHVRAYFMGSFGYFSQPYYHRADYGYRGDWHTESIELIVSQNAFAGLTMQEALTKVHTERNTVREMIATLRAVKPIREPKRELQTAPTIRFKGLP